MTTSHVLVMSSSPITQPMTTKLTPLDQIMPRTYTRMILCIPAASQDIAKTSSVLQQGLAHTIAEIPFLPGKVVPEGGGRQCFITSPADGVSFNIKDLTQDPSWSFEGIRASDFEMARMDGDVLAPLGVFADPESAPVMAVQANFVKGGLLFVICVHHAAADVKGYSLVVETWANHVKGTATLGRLSLDRRVLHSRIDNSLDPTNHREYKIEKSRPSPPSSLPRMLAKVHRWTPEELVILKTNASKGNSWVSTNDALCALLWKSITLARDPQNEGTSMLGFAVDGRSKLNPPLPSTYFGNVNLFASAVHPISSFPSTSLSTLACSIRAAINKLDDARIRNVIDLVDSAEDITDVQFGWNHFLGVDLGETSWTALPLNGLDWGSEVGKVERVRIPNASFDGLCIVLPKLEDGSLEVVIGLVEEHMQRLDLRVESSG